jgi:hypothetical protein
MWKFKLGKNHGITVANPGIQPSSLGTMYSLALALYIALTLSSTSMGMLVYITFTTQLHRLIISRSHSYTNSS